MKKPRLVTGALLTLGRASHPKNLDATLSSVRRASNRGLRLHAHATGTSRVRALPTSNRGDG